MGFIAGHEGRAAGLACEHRAAVATVRCEELPYPVTRGWRQRPQPNPSVERTSNGGAQWVAQQRPATPLAAAHLKR